MKPNALAVDNMCYFVLNSIKTKSKAFQDSLIDWVDSINETIDKETLDVIKESIEVELREGWVGGYGYEGYLDDALVYLGEGAEELFFYKILQDLFVKINKEDEE